MLKFGLSGFSPLLSCFGLLVLMACGERTGKEMSAKAEETYMMARYKDKMDRPSPPARTESMVGSAKVSIDYSQPGVKGRKIWGDLVKYDKIWRTGANEANILETTKPLLVNNDTIPAGKFSLFTIPTAGEWTVIVNKVYDQWGVYDYKQSEDVLRLKLTPEKASEITERMTFQVANSGKVEFAWEYLTFSFNVKPL